MSQTDRRGFLFRAGALLAALTAPRTVQDALDGMAVPEQPFPAATATVAHTGALTASGGLCAPVTPYYDLVMVSPLRDALPKFSADRGGIRYPPPKL